MLMGPEACEERQVGGQRGRHRGDAALEEQALFAEGVEGRGGLPEVAVAAEVVCAQRVDRDEDDARAAVELSDLGVRLSAGSGAEREEEGELMKKS